jgi:hypothetical protein
MLAGVQAEGEGVLVQAEHQCLHQGLWSRQTAALERASPASMAAAAAAREAAAKHLEDLSEQPSWVSTRPLSAIVHPWPIQHERTRAEKAAFSVTSGHAHVNACQSKCWCAKSMEKAGNVLRGCWIHAGATMLERGDAG